MTVKAFPGADHNGILTEEVTVTLSSQVRNIIGQGGNALEFNRSKFTTLMKPN